MRSSARLMHRQVRALEPPQAVVIGGALTGCASALALAQVGMRVTVLDAMAPGQVAGGDRPIALACASQRILQRLGVWDALGARCQPIHRVHVSEQGRFARVTMDAAEHGVTALGYVVEAFRIQQALDGAVNGHHAITRVHGAHVNQCERNVHDVALHTCDATYRGALSVFASGGDDDLLHDRSTHHHAYGQQALVCRVTPSHDHGGVAYERFLQTGPLALLPMRSGECALVWTLPIEQARTLAQQCDETFLAALAHAFGRRLGRFHAPTPRRCFALDLVTAAPVVLPRSVRVGNAAHRLHPVAGQGLNLALRDVATLAEVVRGALAAGVCPGSEQTLRRYGSLRYRDQRLTVGFTHLLARAFAAPWTGLGSARSAAMLGLQLLPAARRALARRAMGLAPPVVHSACEDL